jgi:hypothetical protein
MHWIAPSKKDAANDTLEKRLWAAADQLRANSGLTSTKSLAVAKPIPLLPPVITAIFPANFCPWLLLIYFLLFIFLF